MTGINAGAVALLSEALKRVQSDSVRAWAQSERNAPIWLKAAGQAVARGKVCPDMFAAWIVAEAMGL